MKATKGLPCPHCGEMGVCSVVETRKIAGTLRRRRRCENCEQKWTTTEVLVSTSAKPGVRSAEAMAATAACYTQRRDRFEELLQQLQGTVEAMRQELTRHQPEGQS